MRSFLLLLLLVAAACQARRPDHLRYGRPSREDAVLESSGFALGYREADEQAAWVAYALTAQELAAPSTKRKDAFQEDKRVPTGSATPADYKGSGFDRGHLAPFADLDWSEASARESFWMSNMSPQVPEFNRGIWKDLEDWVREQARARGAVWIVTGPVLDKPMGSIGGNAVTVPRAYYKVLYAPKPRPAMTAYLLPNSGSELPLRRFVVSVDSVEAVTGLDFFPRLPNRSEGRLEAAAVSWME
jgi:endonuclease G